MHQQCQPQTRVLLKECTQLVDLARKHINLHAVLCCAVISLGLRRVSMSLVRLFSTALDIYTINSHAEVFESCPNYWIPRKALEASDVHTAVEREVCRLFHDVMQDILPTDWAGAEFWIQARQPRLQRAGSLPHALVLQQSACSGL